MLNPLFRQAGAWIYVFKNNCVVLIGFKCLLLPSFTAKGHKRKRNRRRALFLECKFDDFFQRVAQDLEQTLKPTHSVPYIILGHDHIAAIRKMEEAWYVNTGTWTLIFEQQGPIEGQEKLTFFQHIQGHRGPPELLRWDDAAGEPARLRFGLTV